MPNPHRHHQRNQHRSAITQLLLFALCLVITLPVTAQSTQHALSKDSVIENIKKRRAIKIGVSLFMPWSMRDKKGDLIGFEIEVGRELAKDMGVKAEFIPTAWDGIIPALVSGKFDVIISGMAVTPQRNLTINFSQPYAYSGMTLLANKKMTEGFSLDDFNSPRVTFAARRGATPVNVIKTLFPRAKLLRFDEDGAATQEVLNGNAHATMASAPTPRIEANKYPEILTIPFEQSFNPTGEAIAYRKGDPDATNFFNNWIASKQLSGWLEKRNDYWFKGTEWLSAIE